MNPDTSINRPRRPRHPRPSRDRAATRDTIAQRARRTAGTPTANLARRALAPTPSSPEQLTALWAMTPGERVDAMWRDQLTLAQLTRWSSRRPAEVPLIAGEFAWIIIRTPAWAEADGATRGTPGTKGSP